MRFTGHLDLILTWERTFRRAGLPLSYSEGYNPRPIINLASPLPLGFISTAEIGDFWLSRNINQAEVVQPLTHSLPPGLLIQTVQEVAHLHGKKLQGLVERCEYTVTLPTYYPDPIKKIDQLLESSKHIRTRKGKEYDLRPLIDDIKLKTSLEPPTATMVISLFTLPTGTGRPDEVLAALNIPAHETVICRSAIILRPGEEN